MRGACVLVSVFMRTPPAYAGLNAWTTNGPAVPFIQAVAVDPTDPDIVYAGTFEGGVFKSTNMGTTWTAMNTGLTNPRDIDSLAIDPTNSTTLYAGGNLGVFKSMNMGTTWAQVNGFSAESLAIALTNPDTVYAGTLGGEGVFKTTNAGATWTAMNTGLTNLIVRSFAMDPAHSDILYAGTQGGVFKSINAGATWAEMNTGLTNPLVLAFAVAPGGMKLYAGTHGGVFVFQSGPVPIPTLPQWGMILLTLSLFAIATWQLAAVPAMVTGISGTVMVSHGSWLTSMLLGQVTATVGLGFYAVLVGPLVAHDGVGAFLAGGAPGRDY